MHLDPQAASQKIAAIMARHGGFEPEEIADQFYIIIGIRHWHLFCCRILARKYRGRRAARPRSGKGQLSRLPGAWALPAAELEAAIQSAFAVAKQIRAEPPLARGRCRLRPRRSRSFGVHGDLERLSRLMIGTAEIEKAAGGGVAAGGTWPPVRHRYAGGAGGSRGTDARLPHAAVRRPGGRDRHSRYYSRLSRRSDAGDQRDMASRRCGRGATGRLSSSTPRPCRRWISRNGAGRSVSLQPRRPGPVHARLRLAKTR